MTHCLQGSTQFREEIQEPHLHMIGDIAVVGILANRHRAARSQRLAEDPMIWYTPAI